MTSHIEAANARNTTDGLASAYQTVQLTGAGHAAFVDTGGLLVIAAVPMPSHRRPAWRPEAEPTAGPQSHKAEPEQSEAPDPASSPFAGPLGVPRTHQERASLLRQNYRAAREETGYLDVPEDVL